ncbi:hypothetical protein HK105_205426 [Polyrhizophydium stewartii]|uniref:C2HC/C3H-type domain-containing protein n=1 Tax=Polyrhizophydium stewartii TaxID=2732419 RepID=A0ABR4N6D8_9FUNG
MNGTTPCTTPGQHTGARDLGWENVGIASLLLLVNGALSLYFGLGLETSIAVAAVRCVVQLSILGYVLKPVFEMDSPLLVLAMALALAIIAVCEVVWARTPYRHNLMFVTVFVSILGSTMLVAFLGNAYAIRAEPWYSPREFIPTLGMTLGNSMSSIAVGLSSVMTQLVVQKDSIEMYLAFGASRWEAARPVCIEAIKIAMLPAINSMSIIGLISIPGMMTGQILGGSSVENAARYQQIISFMITASCGLSTVCAVLAAAFIVVDDKARLRADRLVKNDRKKVNQLQRLRACIKRSLGISQLTRSMATLSAGGVPLYPCTSSRFDVASSLLRVQPGMRKIPQNKLAAHLRTCKGAQSSKPSATDLFNDAEYHRLSPGGGKGQPPASAPVLRGSTQGMMDPIGDNFAAEVDAFPRPPAQLAQQRPQVGLRSHAPSAAHTPAADLAYGGSIGAGMPSTQRSPAALGRSAGSAFVPVAAESLHVVYNSGVTPSSAYGGTGSAVASPMVASAGSATASSRPPSMRVVPKRNLRELPATSSLSLISAEPTLHAFPAASGGSRPPSASAPPAVPVATMAPALQTRSGSDYGSENPRSRNAAAAAAVDQKQMQLQAARHAQPSNNIYRSPYSGQEGYEESLDDGLNQYDRSHAASRHDGAGLDGDGDMEPDTVQDDMLDEYDTEPREMTPCHICGRKFLAERMERHLVACSKAHKARKVFDMSSARIKGTDLEKYASKGGRAGGRAGTSTDKPPKKSNWRAKHEAFVQMVRAAREPAGAPGSSRAAAPAVDPNPDYVTCPTCNRRFNEDSGARHMPLCKEKHAQQASRISNSRGAQNGKEDMLKRRTAYKPPPPKTGSSSKPTSRR